MSINIPVAGRKIFIGPVITPPVGAGTEFDVDDFIALNSDDWTPIAKWQTAGALGGEQQTITTTYINEEWEEVQMGTKNPGTMQNTFGVEDADPGQIALYAAAGDKRLYQFKIEFPDAPVGGTPSYRLFAAYVTFPAEQGGEANTAGMMQVNFVKFKNTVRILRSGTAAPAFTFPPFIYGVAKVAETLTADASNVTGASSTAYLWQISDDGEVGWSTAPGTPDASTYAVDAGAEGKYVRAQVTLTGAGGSAVAHSNVLGPVDPI